MSQDARVLSQRANIMFRMFQRKRLLQNLSKVYIGRIGFLMEHLNELFLEKNTVVKALNKSLLLNIPTNITDPENYYWHDPSCPNLAIGFSCQFNGNPNIVDQFVITGFEDVDNIIITGNGYEDSSPLWAIDPEAPMRPIPPISAIIMKEFWKMPGWKETESDGMDEFRFLYKEIRQH